MAFRKIEQEIVDGLFGILKEYLTTIILYGSVARNEETEESDIDLAVIVKCAVDEDTRNALLEWCADADIKYDCVISVIDIESEMFERWKNSHPFYKNVNEEGIVLWKAA